MRIFSQPMFGAYRSEDIRRVQAEANADADLNAYGLLDDVYRNLGGLYELECRLPAGFGKQNWPAQHPDRLRFETLERGLVRSLETYGTLQFTDGDSFAQKTNKAIGETEFYEPSQSVIQAVRAALQRAGNPVRLYQTPAQAEADMLLADEAASRR